MAQRYGQGVLSAVVSYRTGCMSCLLTRQLTLLLWHDAHCPAARFEMENAKREFNALVKQIGDLRKVQSTGCMNGYTTAAG